MPSYLAAASNARSYITAATMVAGRAPVTSVLICDDRPAVLRGLSEMLGPLRPVIDKRCVTDGFALVDAYTARPAELVLIGVHPGTGTGADGHRSAAGPAPGGAGRHRRLHHRRRTARRRLHPRRAGPAALGPRPRPPLTPGRAWPGRTGHGPQN